MPDVVQSGGVYFDVVASVLQEGSAETAIHRALGGDIVTFLGASDMTAERRVVTATGDPYTASTFWRDVSGRLLLSFHPKNPLTVPSQVDDVL